MNRKERDAVTVKQIRETMEATLEVHITNLCISIRNRKTADAKSLLAGSIASQIERLRQLDSDAGLPGLKKILTGANDA